MLNRRLTMFLNPVQTTFMQAVETSRRRFAMLQLSIMAMVLGAVVLTVLPMPRHRVAMLVSRGAGMGVFGAGLAGLLWTVAVPLTS